MGIGDWGLGIGDWPIPNPQSPNDLIRCFNYKFIYKILTLYKIIISNVCLLIIIIKNENRS